MSTASTHAAVILAAGGSRRLGRPKQLLTRDGETLVHRAARLALETSPRRLLVVVGAHRDEVAAALQDLDCDVIAHTGWYEGLGSSLRAAAVALRERDGAVLIAGCDQPALDAAHLQALLVGAASSPSQVAATLHRGVPGAPAVVPARWFAHGDAPRGDAGFAARLRALPHGDVFLLDAPALVFDLDTEDDVRAAIARGWLDAAHG